MRTCLAVLACTIVLNVTCLGAPVVLKTGCAMDLALQGDHVMVGAGNGLVVQGTIQVAPSPLAPVCDRLVFYVDGRARPATSGETPTLVLDTTTLSDGEHVLRVEAERGGRLALSSGSVTLRVANREGSVVAAAAVQPEQPSPPYAKVYRAALSHEAIWFSGQEGDLERHAFVTGDRMYVTLTDLMRHIGGQIVWGPHGGTIEVHRNDVTVLLTPGSKTASVNNNPVDLGLPVVEKGSLAYVPARALCGVFGVYIEWNKQERRAYVYAPQPGYGLAVRQYPWVDTSAGIRNLLGATPAEISFRNYSGLPVHVLLQGNGWRADWQIHANTGLAPIYVPAGTYKLTVWSRQGEDYEDYITLASGLHDSYDITVSGTGHQATLHSH